MASSLRRLWRSARREPMLPEPSSSCYIEDDELRLRLACALVIDASNGWQPEHRVHLRALRVWQWYHSRQLQAVRYATVFVYLAIPLFETPGWCFAGDGSLRHECVSDTAYSAYETYGWRRLPPAAATALEAACVLLFTAQLAARLYIMGGRRFARSCWPLLQAALLLCVSVDLACTASPLLWRRTPFTRPMRALFVVCSHRKLRDTSAAVVLMLPRLFEFLLLLLALLLFSSWVGHLLFGLWEDAAGFTTFAGSVYSMSMLLTSTNYPDVALPTYRRSRVTMLFFIVFQSFCVFIGLNLMLALVFRAYGTHMRHEAVTLTTNRRRALRAAFEQLTGSSLPGLSTGTVSFTQFSPLLSRLRPDLQPWQIGVCFEALDRNGRGALELHEFEAVLCALRVRFECQPSLAHMRRHRLRLRLRQLITDWRVTLVLDAGVLVNAIVIALQPSQAADVCGRSLGAQLPFMLLWIAESAVKVCAFGVVLVGWNAFDALLSVAALLCLALVAFHGCHADAASLQALRAFVLLRLLRLLRLLAISSRFRLLLRVLRVMRTPFLTFFSLLLAHLFMWAAVGVEVLGGVWFRGAQCLEGTRYDSADYYVNNFNDFPSALITCWELICLNNYPLFMDAGFACVGTVTTSVFFGGFYLMIVFLVMNLFTSFVLDSVISGFDSADGAPTREASSSCTPARADGSAGPTPAALVEAAADEAERFAQACEKTLQAEGNSSVVSVFPQQSDGYTALVRLLARQIVPEFRRASTPQPADDPAEAPTMSPLVVSRLAFTQGDEAAPPA